MRQCKSPSHPVLGCVATRDGDTCHIELARGPAGTFLLALYQSGEHEVGPLICATLKPEEAWALGELLESTSRVRG